MTGKLIADRDWPDFRSLMRWWRTRTRSVPGFDGARRNVTRPGLRVITYDDLSTHNVVTGGVLTAVPQHLQVFDINIVGYPLLAGAAEDAPADPPSKTFRLRFTLPDDGDETTEPVVVESQEIPIDADGPTLVSLLPEELAPWYPVASLGVVENAEGKSVQLGRWHLELNRPASADVTYGVWDTPEAFEVGIGYLAEMRIAEAAYRHNDLVTPVTLRAPVPLPTPTPIARATCCLAIAMDDGYAAVATELRRFTPWSAPGTPIEPEDLPIETDPRTGT